MQRALPGRISSNCGLHAERAIEDEDADALRFRGDGGSGSSKGPSKGQHEQGDEEKPDCQQEPISKLAPLARLLVLFDKELKGAEADTLLLSLDQEMNQDRDTQGGKSAKQSQISEEDCWHRSPSGSVS